MGAMFHLQVPISGEPISVLPLHNGIATAIMSIFASEAIIFLYMFNCLRHKAPIRRRE